MPGTNQTILAHPTQRVQSPPGGHPWVPICRGVRRALNVQSSPTLRCLCATWRGLVSSWAVQRPSVVMALPSFLYCHIEQPVRCSAGLGRPRSAVGTRQDRPRLSDDHPLGPIGRHAVQSIRCSAGLGRPRSAVGARPDRPIRSDSHPLGPIERHTPQIVLTRMSSDPETRNYVRRRRAEGLSTREIMRCLKRYVARQTFKHLPRAA